MAWLQAFAVYAAAASIGMGIGFNWHEAQLERERVADAQAAVTTYRMGLEQYGTDQNGSYPRLADLPGAVLGGGLPPNPWSPTGAPMNLYRGPWPKELNGVGPIAAGEATLSPVGTDLGPGHFPGEGPDDHLTYGTLLYAYQPDNQIYVVYVVGRRGDRAVVVGAAANGSC